VLFWSLPDLVGEVGREPEEVIRADVSKGRDFAVWEALEAARAAAACTAQSFKYA
jgi:hypothetical protein